MLNTAFAWATVLLFGRVAEDRQIYVSVIAFGSVIWLVTLVGVAFPSVGTFLLSFVPLPEWVDKKWVRFAMLGAVVIIPAGTGIVSIFMREKDRRPRGAAAKAKGILKGYPYTVGLATTLAMMIVFAPVIKIKALTKRWTNEHVPVVVEAHDYLKVVDEVQRALERAGFRTERRAASWMLRFPTKILTLFAGGAVSDLVADRMTALCSDKLEVVLHPSDLIISGRAGTAARARAILAEHLVFTPAHLTWDKEAQEIEDRLVAVWEARKQPVSHDLLADIRAIESDLQRLEVPYEEWDVLFRELLLLERAVRDSRSPGMPQKDVAETWERTPRITSAISLGGAVVASVLTLITRSLTANGVRAQAPRGKYPGPATDVASP